MTDEQMQELNVDAGVVVRAIEDGPFADAGIRPGDVLLSINRVEIKSVGDFNSAVAALPKGRSVPVHVVRRGNAQFLVLRVPE